MDGIRVGMYNPTYRYYSPSLYGLVECNNFDIIAAVDESIQLRLEL